MSKPLLVVITGAGMSADSGISTFRDDNGLWNKHRLEEVATPKAWALNPEMVLQFYNERRRQLFHVEPNAGHLALQTLEARYDVRIVTQNVDDLHERAGSSHVLHLHGELRKVRSTLNPKRVYPWTDDLHVGDLCEQGSQLRPHIVWFGEETPLIPVAAQMVEQADMVWVVGTSLLVYPAAGLTQLVDEHTPLYYIDPNPNLQHDIYLHPNLKVIAERAAVALPRLAKVFLNA